jgi:predicted glycosyltransferase
VLVAAGGGGDEEATLRAAGLAATIARVASDVTVALALGPLAHGRVAESHRIRILRSAPLQPLLNAFDGAFAPAGYNTAHEVAKAAVPAALFAQDRPFDDQAARAARFETAGLATCLHRFDDASIATALAWMADAAAPPALEAGGADRAADALLDLFPGPSR